MSQHPEGAPGRRTPSRDRRSRERRVLTLGLLISLVVHIVAIGILGGLLRDRPAPPDAPSTVVIEPPRGMRAVDLADASPSDQTAPEVLLPDPEAPEEEASPSPPRQVADVAATPDAAADAEADDLTAADRLAPRLVDPRLWRPVVIMPREPTLAEVQRRVAEAVELLSDSALAEAERAVRARDWTVTDDDGGRWGISPGLLHLGKLTLPLPIAFPVAITPEDMAREREWYEIQEQAERAVLLESFQERVKAIRERRERERGEDPDPGAR